MAFLRVVTLVTTLASAGAPHPEVAPLTTLHYQLNDKLLYVPVRVNSGPTLWFAVDSGAPHTVIDAAAARRLKLKIILHGETTGVGKGSIGLQHAAPVNIQIGSVTLRVGDPWLIDLCKVPGRKLDGLIGVDFLLHTWSE